MKRLLEHIFAFHTSIELALPRESIFMKSVRILEMDCFNKENVGHHITEHNKVVIVFLISSTMLFQDGSPRAKCTNIHIDVVVVRYVIYLLFNEIC